MNFLKEIIADVGGYLCVLIALRSPIVWLQLRDQSSQSANRSESKSFAADYEDIEGHSREEDEEPSEEDQDSVLVPLWISQVHSLVFIPALYFLRNW